MCWWCTVVKTPTPVSCYQSRWVCRWCMIVTSLTGRVYENASLMPDPRLVPTPLFPPSSLSPQTTHLSYDSIALTQQHRP